MIINKIFTRNNIHGFQKLNGLKKFFFPYRNVFIK